MEYFELFSEKLLTFSFFCGNQFLLKDLTKSNNCDMVYALALAVFVRELRILF